MQSGISIHATHTGGDFFFFFDVLVEDNFNPRHPYGWRPRRKGEMNNDSHFNPRHPYGWRRGVGKAGKPVRHFNPRHPYGWRLDRRSGVPQVGSISIHATHTGGDTARAKSSYPVRNFNPRHPYGWRHGCRLGALSARRFQSTPPIRVATGSMDFPLTISAFQSTPPIRVATCAISDKDGDIDISIHATHTGGDTFRQAAPYGEPSFQSTPPIRVATMDSCFSDSGFTISIHATHTGGDGVQLNV